VMIVKKNRKKLKLSSNNIFLSEKYSFSVAIFTLL